MTILFDAVHESSCWHIAPVRGVQSYFRFRRRSRHAAGIVNPSKGATTRREPIMPPRDPNDDDDEDDAEEREDKRDEEPAVIREPDEGE